MESSTQRLWISFDHLALWHRHKLLGLARRWRSSRFVRRHTRKPPDNTHPPARVRDSGSKAYAARRVCTLVTPDAGPPPVAVEEIATRERQGTGREVRPDRLARSRRTAWGAHPCRPEQQRHAKGAPLSDRRRSELALRRALRNGGASVSPEEPRLGFYFKRDPAAGVDGEGQPRPADPSQPADHSDLLPSCCPIRT